MREWFLNDPLSCLEQRRLKARSAWPDGTAWDADDEPAPLASRCEWPGRLLPAAQRQPERRSAALTAYLAADQRRSRARRASSAARRLMRCAQMERRSTAQPSPKAASVPMRGAPRQRRPRWTLKSASLPRLEGLSRTGHAQARGLLWVDPRILPAQWPTSALIDWTLLLTRMQDIPQREARAGRWRST
ncbi:hypothetical protein ACTMU2_38105 [Cupriavidus basilensis]